MSEPTPVEGVQTPASLRQQKINDVITESLRAFRKSRRSQRHPCEVTSDRLGDHLSRYAERLSGADRDSFSHVRHLLEQLAQSEGGDGHVG